MSYLFRQSYDTLEGQSVTMPIGELHRYKYTQLGKGILFQPDVYVEYGKFEQVISHFRKKKHFLLVHGVSAV